MRLELVNPTPVFQVTCIACGRKMLSNQEPIYADLDGEPFRDYYCAEDSIRGQQNGY